MQIVIAGGYDPYNIYCWNLKTGNLIDVITGHEGSCHLSVLLAR
jgi:WD40 repeat protein